MHEVLYQSDRHKFVLLGLGESRHEKGIPSNQYLVLHEDAAALLDPGGFGLFPILNARIFKYTDPKNIRAIFLSHQDPDVTSGVNVWIEFTGARVYLSQLWLRFIPHLDVTQPENLVPLPDEGGPVEVAPGFSLQVVPAHFLHSPGHINVYDPLAKILFTGDIGTSTDPTDRLFVDDFDAALPRHIEPFHRRYMASNVALRRWVKTVEKLDVRILAPQHGPLYRGQAIGRLLRWLYDLRCGVDLL